MASVKNVAGFSLDNLTNSDKRFCVKVQICFVNTSSSVDNTCDSCENKLNVLVGKYS